MITFDLVVRLFFDKASHYLGARSGGAIFQNSAIFASFLDLSFSVLLLWMKGFVGESLPFSFKL
jgi:hypothetical protein